MAKNLAVLYQAHDSVGDEKHLPLRIHLGRKVYLLSETAKGRLVLIKEGVMQAPVTKDLTAAGTIADTVRQ